MVKRSDLALAALATAAVPGMRPVAVATIHSAEEDPQHQSALVEDVTGRKWIIRSPLGAAAGAELERNDDLIAQLARHLPFKVPAAAGYADLGPEGRAAVYPYVEGQALSLRHLPPGAGLSNAVGRALAAVHNMPRELFEEFAVPVFDAAGFRSRKLAELDRAAETGHVPNGLLARWEQALEAAPMWQFATVPTHGSLDGSSFLVVFSDDDAATGRVVALTGWEQAQVADPAEDFARLVEKSNPRAVDAVFESYAMARAQRPDGYLLHRARLASEMGLLHGLARAVGIGDEDFVRRRADVLRKLDRLTANDDSLVPRTATLPAAAPVAVEEVDEDQTEDDAPDGATVEDDRAGLPEDGFELGDDVADQPEDGFDLEDDVTDQPEDGFELEDDVADQPEDGFDLEDDVTDQPEEGPEPGEAPAFAADDRAAPARHDDFSSADETGPIPTTGPADTTAPIPPPPTLPGDIAEAEGVAEVHVTEPQPAVEFADDDPAVVVERPEGSGEFEPAHPRTEGDDEDEAAVADADGASWVEDDDVWTPDEDTAEDQPADTPADATGPLPMFHPVGATAGPPETAEHPDGGDAGDVAASDDDSVDVDLEAEARAADERLHTLYGMPDPEAEDVAAAADTAQDSNETPPDQVENDDLVEDGDDDLVEDGDDDLVEDGDDHQVEVEDDDPSDVEAEDADDVEDEDVIEEEGDAEDQVPGRD